MDASLIAEWADDPETAKQVAADLATRIRNGRYQRYQPLPPIKDLALEYNVSLTTLRRAKILLCEQGVLAKDNRMYVVA